MSDQIDFELAHFGDGNDLAVLRTHFLYMRKDINGINDNIHDIKRMLGGVATHDDVRQIREEVADVRDSLSDFVTKSEFEAAKRQIRYQSLWNTTKRGMASVTRIAGALAAIGAIGSALLYLTHFWDKLPKP